MAAGDKDIALSTKTVIMKNEHFKSMDSMHSLDFEKLCEVR